jgi:hypothetical protein
MNKETLRKVLIKKWIEREYIENETGIKKYTCKEGTGCYGKDFNIKGLFHEWNSHGDDGNREIVAIVELENGEIELIPSHKIKFL